MTSGATVRALRVALTLLLVDLAGARVLYWLDAGERMFAGGVAGAVIGAIVFGFLALRGMLTFLVPGYVAAALVRSWLERRTAPK
jgi:hypothetical protein